MHHFRAALGLLSISFGVLGVSSGRPAQEAIVLGIAQDGGVPHLGCAQKLCREARRDPAKRRRVASLGLLDRDAGKRFVIDATPDFPAQVEALGGPPDAILLTHAHIGHYLGLAQLGREVLNGHRLPVYCSASMARFLRSNAPWSRLVERENIEIREIAPDVAFPLTERLRATAIRVPHRDEDSDTVAYIVRGPTRSLLWLPDIDKWEKWDRKIEQVVAGVDLAYLDGTFFSQDEIPGRSIADIPHPLVTETVERLRAAQTPAGRVFFVHLNHTNRLYWDEPAVETLRRSGFSVAAEGDRFRL
jgi:pyrroloquinoline quinone biosynthesis protein B